ncbi:hypothetical protein [Deinococcus roseus]|uniref:Phage recombination protein Bet n=1 Tax=Deinococcus roseus TaxID=392414 RepID=A0ABQ2CWI7_9DEIO|nr:hypothetical protein [Deinococcus roseus]GGJ27880.1 hypothetical protein GCM10008938_12440 [Deinococcus roseus]
MTQLATIDAFSPQRFQVMCQMAEVFIRSRMLPPSIQTPEQAIVIMVKGQELGLQPLQALNGINVIQGKPTVSPQLMLSLINRSGKLEDIRFEIGADFVTCTMKRQDRTEHTERFGQKEAQNMGLIGKDNYKRQPLVMYKWRAVAACARVMFPDIIDGLYTPEEMGAEVVVDDEGTMTIQAPQLQEKTLSAEAAQRLTTALTKFGVQDVSQLATAVLGREVKELTTLTKTEGTQIFEFAKKNFDDAQKALEAQAAEKSSEEAGKSEKPARTSKKAQADNPETPENPTGLKAG